MKAGSGQRPLNNGWRFSKKAPTRTEIDEVALHEAGAASAAPEDSDLFEVLNSLRALDHGRQWVRDGPSRTP